MNGRGSLCVVGCVIVFWRVCVCACLIVCLFAGFVFVCVFLFGVFLFGVVCVCLFVCLYV